MKQLLAILFFFSYSLCAIAQSELLSKRIDFGVREVSLKEAIVQLSHQTQIAFSSSGNVLPKRKITLELNDETIETVLLQVLENSGITFKVEAEQVVLFKAPTPIPYYTISGYIKEKESGERLAYATVLESRSQTGISSNEFGFYSITLPSGAIHLNYSYTGCQTLNKKIQLKKDLSLDIALTSTVLLAEVLVVSKEKEDFIKVSANANSLPIQQIKRLPSLGGEVDLIRTISSLSGVNTGTDGFGGIQIRGGNVDQNLVLLDGVPVYNPLHTGGIYSIFNADVIQGAQLYKGTAPARYGVRLSSVLDVKMKEGNRHKMVGRLGIGLTTAKASLEGPIQKGNSSFLVAFRRSLFNSYFTPISKEIKKRKGDIGQTAHSFSDFNSKINFSLGKKDQLYLSVYHGGDTFMDENQSELELATESRTTQHDQNLDWGNTIFALRWNHLFFDKLFVNTTLTSSKFHFQSEEYYQAATLSAGQGETNIDQQDLFYSIYNSSIADKAAKIDLTYLPSIRHSIRFGAEAIAHTFRPGAFTVDQFSQITIADINHPDSIISNSKPIHSQEYSIYLEDKWNISKRLRVDFGLRTTLLAVQQAKYWSIQPRLSTRFQLTNKILLHADVGKTNQNLHQLSISGIGLPSDLWVPATANIRPQSAWQSSIGLTTALLKGFSLDLVAYQKSMQHLVAYQEGANFLIESIVVDAVDWESKVTSGKGKSYGFELSLKKEVGPLTGWLNYTWSKSTRQFETINNGQEYDFKFDRPHSFKIAGVYQISPKWSVSSTWSYQTGLPTTLPISEYTFYSSNLFSPSTVLNTGQKNSFRLPAFHRLDIEMVFDLGKKPGKQLFKIGVANAYNRKNPLYYRLTEKRDGSGERAFVQVSLLPILPSLSYSLLF